MASSSASASCALVGPVGSRVSNSAIRATLEAIGARKIDYPVDAATLESYAGKYVEGEMSVSFTAKDGKLLLDQGPGSGETLVSAAKDRFKFLQTGMIFKFGRDGSGAVANVNFSSRGGEVSLKKVAAK